MVISDESINEIRKRYKTFTENVKNCNEYVKEGFDKINHNLNMIKTKLEEHNENHDSIDNIAKRMRLRGKLLNNFCTKVLFIQIIKNLRYFCI